MLSLTPDQVSLMPERLEATPMVVRVAAGAGGWQAPLEMLRGRGARAGLYLVGVPADGDPALGAAADTLIVEPGAAEADRLAFDLKRILSEARGRRPETRLLIAAPDDQVTALRERGLAPYVDEFMRPAAPIATTADLVAPRVPGPFVVRLLPSSSVEAASIAAAAVTLQRWLPEGLVPVLDRALSCGGRRMPTYLNPRTLDLAGVTASCPPPGTVTSDMPGAAIERLDLDSVAVFLVHAGDGDRFAAGVEVGASRTLTVEEIIARHQAAVARQASRIETLISEGTMALTFEAPGFVAPVTITSEATIYQRSGSPNQTDIRQANIRVNGVSFNAGGGVPKLPIIEPERASAPPLAITLSDVYAYRLAGRERIRGRDAYVITFSPRDAGESLYKGRAWIDAATFGMVRVAAAQTELKGAITASEQADDFELDAVGRWLLARSDVRQTYEGASVRTPIHRLLVVARHAVNAADFAARRSEALASADVMLRDTPDGYRYLAKDGGRKKEDGGRKKEDGSTESGSTEDGKTEGGKTEGGKTEGGKTEGGTAPDVRVVAGRSSRIRTFAFGVIVDPNISQPLPFAGLSYVDFDLFGTGAQFSGFFAGTYLQLAFTVPSIGGTRWQLGGRAFGIATSYNDRAFVAGRELYPLDIRQRPAQASIWLLRPLSARTALRVEYDWDYNRFERHDVTAPDFVIPRNQNAHAIRIGLDGQFAGWQGSVWGSYAHRIGWRPWGLPAQRAAFSDSESDYQRFGASLLRSQALSPRITTRVEGAVMGGRDLDRFSRYAFGTFDNRLHGYPSALIRYDRGAVIRTAAAVSLFRVIRLDGFADSALAHDPGFGPGLRHYPGLGVALEAPAPFKTLLSLEWGYGLQGIDTDGRRGTHVVRLSGYKVF